MSARQIVVAVWFTIFVGAFATKCMECGDTIPALVDSSRFAKREMLIRDFGPPQKVIEAPYHRVLEQSLHGRDERATRQLTTWYPGKDVRQLMVTVLTWSNECSHDDRRLVAVIDRASDRVIDVFTTYIVR